MTFAAPPIDASTPRSRRLSRLTGGLVAACLAAAGLTAQPAQAADTGSITGKVFTKAVGSDKTAANGGYLYVYRWDTVDKRFSSVDADPSDGDTDAYRFDGGTYTLPNLPAGSYTFEVHASPAFQSEYYNDAFDTLDATALEVGSGTTAADDVVLEVSGQITGRVTDRAGKPLANASILFKRSENAGGTPVRTDADGVYTSVGMRGGGLVKGTYKVEASLFPDSPDAPTYESRYWKDSTTFAGAADVAVTPGETTGAIDIALEQAPRIRLTVKDPAGNPVPDAAVGVWQFYDGEWGPRRAGPNETDATGVYRQTVRIGDRYKFYFTPPAGVGGVTEWYDNAYSEDTAREVTATSHGQVLDLTIQLGDAPVVAGSTPTITGTPEVGQQLTADPGTWGPAGVELTYQWFANGAPIEGATRATYTPSMDDVTKAITVQVTGALAHHTTTVKASAATAPVATPPVVVPVVTGAAPVVTGTPRSGKTLSVSTGSWGPAGVTLARQWRADGAAITGATGSTLRLSNSHAGKRITVTVTGTIEGGAPVARTSAATAKVQGVLKAQKVTISGTTKVGRTLRAKTGSWGPKPVTSSYKWYRNGRAISGQSKSTYKLRKADVSKRITVRVTQRKSSYVTISKLSSRTGKVKKK